MNHNPLPPSRILYMALLMLPSHNVLSSGHHPFEVRRALARTAQSVGEVIKIKKPILSGILLLILCSDCFLYQTKFI